MVCLMKAPKEIKRWIAVIRHHSGKKNGVISWLFDNPELERKLRTNKRINKRIKRIGEE